MSESAIKHVTIPGLRLHLRRGDPDMLWVNGQNLLLLNRTAADFVETFIDLMCDIPITWILTASSRISPPA